MQKPVQRARKLLEDASLKVVGLNPVLRKKILL